MNELHSTQFLPPCHGGNGWCMKNKGFTYFNMTNKQAENTYA